MDIVFEPDPVTTPIMILTGGPTVSDIAAVGLISFVRLTGGGMSLLEYNTMTPYKCTRTPAQRAAMLRERAEADNNWCNCGGYGPCASRGGEFHNPGCTGYPVMRTAVVAWLDHVNGWEVGGILSHIAMVMRKGNNKSRTVATGIRAFIDDPAVQAVMRDIDTGRAQVGTRAPLGVRGPLLGMLGIDTEDDIVMSVYDLCWSAGIRPVLVGLALEWSAPSGSDNRQYRDPISGPYHHLLCKLRTEYSDRSSSSWSHDVLFSLLTANIFNAVERAVAPTKTIWDCWRPTFADAALFRSWTSGAGAAGAPGCRSTARGGGSCVNHHVECGAMAMLREPLTDSADGGVKASKSAFDVWPREIRDAIARRTCSYARDWEPATAIRVRLAESSLYHDARGDEVECKCNTLPPTSDDADKFIRDVWSQSISCNAPRSGRASVLRTEFPSRPEWHKGRSPLVVVADARTTLGRHEPHSGCGIERVSPPDRPRQRPRSPSPRSPVDSEDTD
ncbi:hypothetical protein O9K51_10044 [Purpureocillium lavendulum]|uniref:Uncharacterized protein n=1 Tax=Purpureocillium lavendulum TaxID=1247861 RepID=A0AB34FGE4_9HYPO|nr:hypothetical protein O9K51_10044 [Purpureocillium lavendulum]